MSARDKGAVQRADSNGNRRDKGAVEAHVEAPPSAALPINIFRSPVFNSPVFRSGVF